MRTSVRRTESVRLACESLEDRTTPAVGYTLSGGNLLAFDTATPAVTTSTPITGIVAGETLVGADYRAQNGLLYALGVNATANNATLYLLSTRTGTATPIGTPSGIAFVDPNNVTVAIDLPDPAVTGYGIDFNPAADRFRVVAGSLNFRVNPNTGGPIDGNGDGSLPNPANQINTDGPISGLTTNVDAAAYTNNMPNNGGLTTQYTLDSVSDRLFIQTPPNNGTQVSPMMGGAAGVQITLGGAVLNFTGVSGFDIGPGVNTATSGAPVAAGTAFANLTVGGSTGLYSINLVTGAATLLGTVGNGATPTTGLAIQSDALGTPSIGLSADGTQLIRFNSATPGTVTTVAIPAAGMTGGVATGEVLVAIDFRPQTGQLYGLAVNLAGTTTATLYLIDPQLATLTAVGPVGGIAFNATTLPPASAGYGMDFNPTVDRIRVTTGTGLNFRINPNNGAAVDGNLATATTIEPDAAINGNGVTGIVETAYTNSFGQPLTGGVTSQYTLDAVGNRLLIQFPPNNGTQTNPLPITVGGVPLDFDAVTGFDISGGVRVAANGAVATGFGLATMVIGGQTQMYSIDLSTGNATLVGTVGAGAVGLRGLTTADTSGGVVSFQSAAVNGAEGGGVDVILTRTGGTGPQVVTLTATGGTAVAGTDFPAGPFTVAFAPGATTATLTIPFNDDGLAAADKTLQLTISAVSNGLVSAVTPTTTLTFADAGAAPVPTPPPAFYSGAAVVGRNLVLQGAGVAGGTQVIPVPAGTSVIFADLSGDGQSDLILITPDLVVAQDGASGRFLALAADVTGDGTRDLLVFNPDGTTTTTDGRTGLSMVM